MKRCNANGTCPDTGSDICCKYCKKLRSCENPCEDAFETEDCPDMVNEPDSMTLFRNHEASVVNAMVAVLKQKKDLEEREANVRAQLVAAMDTYGIKSFENEMLKVVYVAESTRTTIDSKALKKDLPDVAEKYSKTSSVKDPSRFP